jgi:hypothetical protein
MENAVVPQEEADSHPHSARAQWKPHVPWLVQSRTPSKEHRRYAKAPWLAEPLRNTTCSEMRVYQWQAREAKWTSPSWHTWHLPYTFKPPLLQAATSLGMRQSILLGRLSEDPVATVAPQVRQTWKLECKICVASQGSAAGSYRCTREWPRCPIARGGEMWCGEGYRERFK